MTIGMEAFLTAFEKPAPGTQKRRIPKLAAIDVGIRNAEDRARTGEWADANGATFVGLYALCHRMIYGIVPTELYRNGDFQIACRMARRTLHELFRDDGDDMAAFVKWCWEREKRRNSWAQASGYDRNRLSPRTQFSPTLLTDYRIAASKQR